MGRQDCIRAAATFHFKPDLPTVPLHLPPTSPLLMHHCHTRAQACLPKPPPQKKNLSQTTNHPHHTGCSCSCTPLLQRPLTSYFQPFLWVRPPHFLYASVYPISQDASPPPPTSFLVMNDRWSSHWQLGSWCHIITVSPFRQNYQITPVLKRLGRLTG